MRQLGSVVTITGLIAMIIGLLGLMSILLQKVGVGFGFFVSPWYGPFLGGLLFLYVGRRLQC